MDWLPTRSSTPAQLPVVGVNPDPQAFRRRPAAFPRARPAEDHARGAGGPPRVQTGHDGEGNAQRRAHALRRQRFLRRTALARFRALRHPPRQAAGNAEFQRGDRLDRIWDPRAGSRACSRVRMPSAPRSTAEPPGRRRGNRLCPPMGWDADYLYFTVREPFPSRTTAATLVFGAVTDPASHCACCHRWRRTA